MEERLPLSGKLKKRTEGKEIGKNKRRKEEFRQKETAGEGERDLKKGE